MGSIDGNGIKKNERKKDVQQAFQSIHGQICENSSVESLKNTAVAADIVSFLVCVCDVMNKAGVCGSSVYQVRSHSYFCSSLVESEPTWLRPEKLKVEARLVS